jgi:hypothetical protein
MTGKGIKNDLQVSITRVGWVVVPFPKMRKTGDEKV